MDSVGLSADFRFLNAQIARDFEKVDSVGLSELFGSLSPLPRRFGIFGDPISESEFSEIERSNWKIRGRKTIFLKNQNIDFC